MWTGIWLQWAVTLECFLLTDIVSDLEVIHRRILEIKVFDVLMSKPYLFSPFFWRTINSSSTNHFTREKDQEHIENKIFFAFLMKQFHILENIQVEALGSFRLLGGLWGSLLQYPSWLCFPLSTIMWGVGARLPWDGAPHVQACCSREPEIHSGTSGKCLLITAGKVHWLRQIRVLISALLLAIMGPLSS